MSRTILDINVIQTVPPSNLNRDDTGSPKTAVYGGVRRARVSSQSWKRATRLDFRDRLDKSDLGTRTKRVVEMLAQEIVRQDAAIELARAEELAVLVFKAIGIKLSTPRKSTKEKPLPDESGYLLFLSAQQIARLAQAAVDANGTDDAEATIKAAQLKKTVDLEHSIDIALFGRMVADSSDLNVDAAAQVAHALSVHAVDNEFDFFTAVDDHKDDDDEEDAGAGMMGTVEFNSATLYRYATLDVDALRRNLGSTDATRRAIEAFLQSFVRSMPSGKQNTFANRTLPDAVVISLRDSQPVNLAGAFEKAVTDSDRVQQATALLAAHLQEVDETFGTTPVRSWVVRTSNASEDLDQIGERGGLDAAIDGAVTAAAERLTDSAP
jgi:CRISPR system Cascade subunit CasC